MLARLLPDLLSHSNSLAFFVNLRLQFLVYLINELLCVSKVWIIVLFNVLVWILWSCLCCRFSTLHLSWHIPKFLGDCYVILFSFLLGWSVLLSGLLHLGSVIQKSLPFVYVGVYNSSWASVCTLFINLRQELLHYVSHYHINVACMSVTVAGKYIWKMLWELICEFFHQSL